jgi:hypothetical protein
MRVCNLNHTSYAFDFAGDYPQRRYPHKLIGSGCKPEPAGGLGVNGAQEEERGDLEARLTRKDF